MLLSLSSRCCRQLVSAQQSFKINQYLFQILRSTSSATTNISLNDHNCSNKHDTVSPAQVGEIAGLRVKNIRKSMITYLERVKQNQKLLDQEKSEFDLGKRHLANMMGVDVEELDQETIDEAIEYLFPSGLFDRRARPQMKLQFKRQKEAQFDIDGRPLHFLFYTTKPILYECIHNIGNIIEELNKFEDEQIAKGIVEAPAGSNYILGDHEWFSLEQFRLHWMEARLNEKDYSFLLRNLNALVAHPYSLRAKEFIKQFTIMKQGQSIGLQLPTIGKCPNTGKPFIELVTGKKRHSMRTSIWFDGTGKCEIEGKDILYFPLPHHREAIMFPMQMTGLLGRIDFVAKYEKIPRVIGDTAVAQSIRYALALAIASYIPEQRERLRLAGLLTEDIRQRERKKFGQEGARRKYTWKKR